MCASSGMLRQCAASATSSLLSASFICRQERVGKEKICVCKQWYVEAVCRLGYLQLALCQLHLQGGGWRRFGEGIRCPTTDGRARPLSTIATTAQHSTAQHSTAITHPELRSVSLHHHQLVRVAADPAGMSCAAAHLLHLPKRQRKPASQTLRCVAAHRQQQGYAFSKPTTSRYSRSSDETTANSKPRAPVLLRLLQPLPRPLRPRPLAVCIPLHVLVVAPQLRPLLQVGRVQDEPEEEAGCKHDGLCILLHIMVVAIAPSCNQRVIYQRCSEC